LAENGECFTAQVPSIGLYKTGFTDVIIEYKTDNARITYHSCAFAQPLFLKLLGKFSLFLTPLYFCIFILQFK